MVASLSQTSRQVIRAVSQKSSVATASYAAVANEGYKCIKIEIKDEVAVVRMDAPNSKVNTLSNDMTADFAKAIPALEADQRVKAVVLISGKGDNFIAGADIHELSRCETAEELSGLSRAGQQLLEQFAGGKPKVAAIHGACLGGGLEVALACHYRIATEASKTVLGLPEVMLGLLPGAGGTQRLPALVGAQAALPLMLTGQSVRATKALRMRLVDQVADPAALEAAALHAARALADLSLQPDRTPASLAARLTRWGLERTAAGRNFLFDQARKTVLRQTKGKYPAPLAILKAVRAGLEEAAVQGDDHGHGHGHDHDHGHKGKASDKGGYATEARLFGELGMTPESRALVGIFQGQTAAKKNPFAEHLARGGSGDAAASRRRVGVLGAGLMGAGIAQVTADKAGLSVLLQDVREEAVVRGTQQVAASLQARARKGQLGPIERDRILARIHGLTAAHPHAARLWQDVGVVVEAVYEDLGIKHKVLREIEARVPADCILATNTSALPIADIAAPLARPAQVVGMHYFSPVDKMPLLEVIPHAGTAPAVAAAAVDLGLRQGKTVIVVKDVPGFYVNRSLGPYMAETFALLRQGVDPRSIDAALRDFGFPVGPISLADEVGIDVAAHVQAFLSKHLHARMHSAGGDAVLARMIDAGLLGRKASKGFFAYPASAAKGKSKGKSGSKDKEFHPDTLAILKEVTDHSLSKKATANEDIQFRMSSRFVNEAIYCLQDGIIRSPSDGDVGAVFGIGFPPFLGGPFRLVDQIGAQKYVDRMLRYRDLFGEHFEPAPLLVDMAKGGKKFHN